MPQYMWHHTLGPVAKLGSRLLEPGFVLDSRGKSLPGWRCTYRSIALLSHALSDLSATRTESSHLPVLVVEPSWKGATTMDHLF